MCLSCTIEQVTGIDLSGDEGHDALARYREEHGGRIPWPDATDRMFEAAQYIASLYANPAGGTGGPVHIVTDDFNVTDGNLKYCRDNLERWTSYNCEEADEERCKALSLWILDLLQPMTEAERSVTMALGHGELSIVGGKIFMPSTEFPVREDVCDDTGKIVGWRWGFRSRVVES